ncbi:hypothetical protein CORC01_13163 [Colletotrichum orchidophilum]|uniref:Uncharacterized protein n=1 Tax=Colletotrichum orchidophilum TaxID=1209926 RepID=A0A1G4AQR6_9PEZI|nr:uncharacterized protein CORC01_13163 [Colletotrichum orchidophilum]OHE91514.1 hypothetical protein CORC01_13163 [Colletotrichum orchidophilum]
MPYDLPFSCWSPFFLVAIPCSASAYRTSSRPHARGDPSVQSAYMPLSLLTSKRAADPPPPPTAHLSLSLSFSPSPNLPCPP